MFSSFQDGLVAITEVSNDCVDTKNNFMYSLGVLTAVAGDANVNEIAGFAASDLANKAIPLRYPNGKVLNLCFENTPIQVRIKDPSTGLSNMLGAFDSAGNFVKNSEAWAEDELTFMLGDAKYDISSAMSEMTNSLQTCELIESLLSVYQNSGNRLAAFNSLMAADVSSLSSSNKRLYQQFVIGLSNIGSSPAGFLNLVRQAMNAVKGSATADDSTNSIIANDTDYTILPYAWSGVLRGLMTVVSAVLIAVGGAITKVIGILGLAISALIRWLNSELDSMDEWKFVYDVDNYELNVPLVTCGQTKSWFISYLDNSRVVIEDYPEEGDSYIVGQDVYDDLITFFSDPNDLRSVVLLKTPFMDIFFWSTDTTRENFYMEAYLNVNGVHFMNSFANYSSGTYQTRDIVYDRMLAMDQGSDFSWDVDYINSKGVSDYMEKIFARFINGFCQICWYARNPNSDILDLQYIYEHPGTPLIAKLSDLCMNYTNHFGPGSTPDEVGMTVDNFVNEFIYSYLRNNPHQIFYLRQSMIQFMWDRGRWDKDLEYVVDFAYPTHDFMFTAPRFGARARGALIGATIAIASTAAILFIGAKIGKALITRSLTARYAQVQAAQNALANADPNNTDEYKAKLKAFRKGVKRYNLLATISGNSKLSKVNGWEVASDSSISDTGSINALSQLSDNYINPTPTYGESVVEVEPSVSSVIKLIIG